MMPRFLKSQSLAPVRPTRTVIHETACGYAEEQFKLKGGLPPTWLIAFGTTIGWLETDWQSGRDKDLATSLIRGMLFVTDASAYSFITEAWVSSAFTDKAEEKHWLDFAQEHGVKNLPPHLRDDVLIVHSYDRDGGLTSSRYLVNMPPRGPNWLGIRIDDEMTGNFTGRMGNLFDQPLDEWQKDAARRALVEAFTRAKARSS